MNYFELYELPITFIVDAASLKKKFYELSKRYHPDFHANESEEKQQKILELSTLVNKAYQVLSDPLKRVEYILTQFQLLPDGEKYELPQDFLMEMMDVNEALVELEFEPNADIQELTTQVELLEKNLSDELELHINAFDSEHQQDVLLKIKDVWYRQKYLLRIRDSLNRFAAR